MFTAFALSLAVAAPVPAPATPAPAGVAPRVQELKADANGKVMVQVVRTEKLNVAPAIAPAPGNNAAPPAAIAREVRVSKMVELGEVKDLTITTADGKKVATEDALKRLADGAIVIVSGDGKPVSPAFLKVFKDDTLVLASPELAAPQSPAIGRPLPGVRPGIQIQPLPAQIQPLPAQIQPGGVIKIQVGGAGGVIQAVPLVPAQPAPEKAPEK